MTAKTLAPMAGALIGIMNTMQSSIERCIHTGEFWTYQYGSSPVATEDGRVVDSIEVDNECISLGFSTSEEDGYTHSIIATFFLPDEPSTIDGLTIDVNLETGEILVTYPDSEDNEASNDFNCMMDIGSIITAMAVFGLYEDKLHEHSVKVAEAKLAEEARMERRSRLQVVRT